MGKLLGLEHEIIMGKNKNVMKAISTAIFLVVGLLNIFPFIFMVSSSFKLNANVFEYPFRLIPKPFVSDAYMGLFASGSLFYRWYANTIVLVLVTLVLRILLVGITAYSLARLKYKGRDTLFFIFMLTLMIPQDMLIVPRYIVLYMLKLTNSMWSVSLIYTFEFFMVFLVRQFYISIPKELSEAAIIDGCSHIRIFFSIILPLSKPAMVTMALFTFVWQWNDYTLPYTFINDLKKQMISVGIKSFATEHTIDYSTQMAGAVLSLVPIIIVFLFVQKYFIEGIATSGIKG